MQVATPSRAAVPTPFGALEPVADAGLAAPRATDHLGAACGRRDELEPEPLQAGHADGARRLLEPVHVDRVVRVRERVDLVVAHGEPQRDRVVRRRLERRLAPAGTSRRHRRPRRTRRAPGSARPRASVSTQSVMASAAGSPDARTICVRRLAQTLRQPDDPRRDRGGLAQRHAAMHLELRAANQPPHASRRVPLAPEPQSLRVHPRGVLRPPQQAGRHATGRPGRTRRTGPGSGPFRCGGRRRRHSFRPASRPSVSSVNRRVPSRGAVDRASRTSHERRPSNSTSADEQPRALVGGVAARVVELVEHVGVDPAGAPLAVVDLGARLALHGHVVRVDLGRGRRRTGRAVRAGPGRVRRAARAAVRSAPPRSRRGTGSAPARRGPRPRGRHRGSPRVAHVVAGSCPGEQRREHRRPPRAVGGLAVHHRARHAPAAPASRPRAGRPRARRADRPGSPRRRSRARRVAASWKRIPGALRPAASSARRTACGSVESQSIARWGSVIRAASSASRSIASTAGAGDRPSVGGRRARADRRCGSGGGR